jgi:hypothetical protein
MTEDEFDAKSATIVLDYAATASPRIWHQMAMDWNWDSGLYFFRWLLNNPATDRATALMMYWMAGPRWYKQVADHAAAQAAADLFISLDKFDFLESLEQKYCAGFFATNQFAYDPAHDHDGYDWTQEYTDTTAVREIPALLFQKLPGETVEKPWNFIEGLPKVITQQLDALYEQFEEEE